jgi:6-phosphogluconolactonase
VSAREREVFADASELAGTAARRALEVLEEAIDEHGVAHLVVTGGGILEQTLAAMAVPEALDWSKLHVWWGDERYVPADSDDRNDRPAMDKLFDKVPYEPDHLHRMPAADGVYVDAEDAADAYAQQLRSLAPDGADVPAFDVVLLGVGPDGHCASLFPHHPGTRVADRPVIAVHDSPKPPPTRLSLTFPALDAAKQVWFVVSGSGKADAVARALDWAASPEDVPSSGPRGRDRTLWLLDRDAAAKL